MSKQKMIGDVPGSVLGMLADLSLKLREERILPAELDLFLKRQNPFQTVDDLFGKKVDFYRKIGVSLDVSGIVIPKKKQGFDRLLIIAQGLTLNGVYDECAKRFPCGRWTDDLDKAVTINDRVPDKTYAVWIRDRVEADEELKNLSADDLKEKGIPYLTLLERMVLELEHYMETGKHLDASNITLCAGSRCSYGRLPCADWRGSQFNVDRRYPRPTDALLRARAAVS